MIDLSGRVALVTGSTSGIGKAIAEALAQAGATIVLHGSRDTSDTEAQRAALAAKYGPVAYIQADLTKPEKVTQMIETVVEAFGRLDILVNNAGKQYVAPVETFPLKEWNEIVAVHLTAPFLAIQAAIPHMNKNRWGRILNITSAQAWDPQPNKPAYSAAKGGLVTLTREVARELADTGTTCNSISPGLIDTPLVRKQIENIAQEQGISIEAAQARLLRVHPTGKFVPIEEVVGIALSLCSEEAGHTTGTDSKPDAGWIAAAAEKPSPFMQFAAATEKTFNRVRDATVSSAAHFAAAAEKACNKVRATAESAATYTWKILLPKTAAVGAATAMMALVLSPLGSIVESSMVEIKGGETITRNMVPPAENDWTCGPIATSGAHVFFRGRDLGDIDEVSKTHPALVDVAYTDLMPDGKKKIYIACSAGP